MLARRGNLQVHQQLCKQDACATGKSSDSLIQRFLKLPVQEIIPSRKRLACIAIYHPLGLQNKILDRPCIGL
jgi:hypothetical protein